MQKHVAVVVETILVQCQPYQAHQDFRLLAFPGLLGRMQKQFIHKSTVLETINFCDETVYLFLTTDEVLCFKPR